METNEIIRQLLQQYYNISHPEILPAQRQKSQWENDNKFGFLNGILDYGQHHHIEQLSQLLSSNHFEQQEDFFIQSMYNWYILPFKQNNGNDSRCHTPATSRSPSVVNLDGQEKELSHYHLKKEVTARDVVCLFCWGTLALHSAHIVAQKNGLVMSIDEDSVFRRAGLAQKHHVQNGLLLCAVCHEQFDSLKRYIELKEDRMLVKIVNQSNDENDVNLWCAIDVLKFTRETYGKYLDKNRQVVETNGEMALYFVQSDTAILPNKKALEFHKIACLIWRMAGGAEPDEEYCSDDDEYIDPVSTAEKRRIYNWTSVDTLNNESVQ